MKTYFKIFAVLFSVAILAACTSEMSPALKEAQGIADGVASMRGTMDSTLGANIAAVTDMISKADSTVDSTTMAAWNGKLGNLMAIKEKLGSWTAPAFPSAEELAKGEVQDSTILGEQKAAQAQLNDLKAACDAEMAH